MMCKCGHEYHYHWKLLTGELTCLYGFDSVKEISCGCMNFSSQ